MAGAAVWCSVLWCGLSCSSQSNVPVTEVQVCSSWFLTGSSMRDRRDYGVSLAVFSIPPTALYGLHSTTCPYRRKTVAIHRTISLAIRRASDLFDHKCKPCLPMQTLILPALNHQAVILFASGLSYLPTKTSAPLFPAHWGVHVLKAGLAVVQVAPVHLRAHSILWLAVRLEVSSLVGSRVMPRLAGPLSTL